MPSGGGHTAADWGNNREDSLAWGECMRARIVQMLVSEWSWTGFPGRGDHAAASQCSKGANPSVKLAWLGGSCTWHRAQRRTAPAHLHTWQQRAARGSPDGLVGTLLSPSIMTQR
jgi:hypothetical protein